MHQAELQNLQQRVQTAVSPGHQKANTDFTHALPSPARSHDVVHDISRFAQARGVQIESLVVNARAASASELGKIHFNLLAQSDYRSAKAWLAELLGRFPALGVQSLSMRMLPDAPTRVHMQMELVLFVKD